MRNSQIALCFLSLHGLAQGLVGEGRAVDDERGRFARLLAGLGCWHLLLHCFAALLRRMLPFRTALRALCDY